MSRTPEDIYTDFLAVENLITTHKEAIGVAESERSLATLLKRQRDLSHELQVRLGPGRGIYLTMSQKFVFVEPNKSIRILDAVEVRG